jgi:hypothetical protein
MTSKKSIKVANIRVKKFVINDETSEELRRTFKAKWAMNEKAVKDIIAEFMKKYIKNNP